MNRNKFRSTYMHNTLTLNGEEINYIDQSKLFYLNQNTEVNILEWDINDGAAQFIGEHNGFKQLDIDVKHRRYIKYYYKKRVWVISDQIISDKNVPFIVETNFHSTRKVSINYEVSSVQVGNVIIKSQNNKKFSAFKNESEYSPSYGVKLPSTHIMYKTDSNNELSLQIEQNDV